MFTAWEWIRFCDGWDSDWVDCKIGCKLHRYKANEIQFLLEAEFISSIHDLHGAAPAPHRICCFECEQHHGGGVAILKKAPSNAAQHIARCHSNGFVALFR